MPYHISLKEPEKPMEIIARNIRTKERANVRLRRFADNYEGAASVTHRQGRAVIHMSTGSQVELNRTFTQNNL